MLFSYGSGCVAAMFSLSFNFSNDKSEELYNALKKSAQAAFDRLNKRIKFSPEHFTQILEAREEIVRNGGFLKFLFKNLFFLIFKKNVIRKRRKTQFHFFLELFIWKKSMLLFGVFMLVLTNLEVEKV